MLNISEYEAMAKLKLTDDFYAQRAELLITGFSALDGINTDNTEPLVSVLALRNILREDVSHQLLPRDEILRNAPEQQDGYFQVPGILE